MSSQLFLNSCWPSCLLHGLCTLRPKWHIYLLCFVEKILADDAAVRCCKHKSVSRDTQQAPPAIFRLLFPWMSAWRWDNNVDNPCAKDGAYYWGVDRSWSEIGVKIEIERNGQEHLEEHHSKEKLTLGIAAEGTSWASVCGRIPASGCPALPCCFSTVVSTVASICVLISFSAWETKISKESSSSSMMMFFPAMRRRPEGGNASSNLHSLGPVPNFFWICRQMKFANTTQT